jgi:hypothetical protein
VMRQGSWARWAFVAKRVSVARRAFVAKRVSVARRAFVAKRVSVARRACAARWGSVSRQGSVAGRGLWRGELLWRSGSLCQGGLLRRSAGPGVGGLPPVDGLAIAAWIPAAGRWRVILSYAPRSILDPSSPIPRSILLLPSSPPQGGFEK